MLHQTPARTESTRIQQQRPCGSVLDGTQHPTEQTRHVFAESGRCRSLHHAGELPAQQIHTLLKRHLTSSRILRRPEPQKHSQIVLPPPHPMEQLIPQIHRTARRLPLLRARHPDAVCRTSPDHRHRQQRLVTHRQLPQSLTHHTRTRLAPHRHPRRTTTPPRTSRQSNLQQHKVIYTRSVPRNRARTRRSHPSGGRPVPYSKGL